MPPRSTRFLAAAQAHNSPAAAAAAASATAASSLDGAIASPASAHAFGRTNPSRIRVDRAEVPPVAIERFEIEPTSSTSSSSMPATAQSSVSASAALSRRAARRLADEYARVDAAEEIDTESMFDLLHEPTATAAATGGDPGADDEDADPAVIAGIAAQRHLDSLLAARRNTFLTDLDLDTQMHLMRAHYRGYTSGVAQKEHVLSEAAAAATQEQLQQQRREQTQSGSLSARAQTSHAASRPTGTGGSLTARPSSTADGSSPPAHQKRQPPPTLSLLHSPSLGRSNGSAAALSATGWTATGSGGSKALLFDVALDRFPAEEKHELGLNNPVSLFSALVQELNPAVINARGKMHLKYRIPRSSELGVQIFVPALPGQNGIQLKTGRALLSPDGSGGEEGYESCIPRRNLALLNPATLDPITPGPGAYLGLTRTKYEREKVAQLGGVMRIVTATNGVLRTKLRAAEEAAAAHAREQEQQAQKQHIPGTSVADRVSHTKSGRAQTSAAYQAAVLGTGSLTDLSRRRLRNLRASQTAFMDTRGECVTSFGLSERTGVLGQWDVDRARTFLGPGLYAGPIEGRGVSSFAKFGNAAATAAAAAAEVVKASAPQNALESRKRRARGQAGAGGEDGAAAAAEDEDYPVVRIGDGTVDLEAEASPALFASIVASKLNYNPLPSANRIVPRNGLASVPACVLENPGPTRYNPRPVAAHIQGPVMVQPHERELLEALRGGGSGDLGLSAAPTTNGNAATVTTALAASEDENMAADGSSSAPRSKKHNKKKHKGSKSSRSSGAGARAPPRAHHAGSKQQSRRSGHIGERIADTERSAARGYFVEGERSIGLSYAKTPGVGTYTPDLLALTTGATQGAGQGGSSNGSGALPSLAPFNSTAPRGVGISSREVSRSENATTAAQAKAAATAKKKNKKQAANARGRGRASDSSDGEHDASADSSAPLLAHVSAAAALAAARDDPQARQAQLADLEHLRRVRAQALERTAASALGIDAPAARGTLRNFLENPPPPTTLPGTKKKSQAEQDEDPDAIRSRLKPPSLSISTADGDGAAAASPRASPRSGAEIAAAAARQEEEEAHRRWLLAQRRLDIRNKGLRLAEERRERILSIQKRETHIAQRSSVAEALQRWLVLIVHASFIRSMHSTNSRRQSVLREMAAALKIQESWAAFRTRREVMQRFQGLRKKLQGNLLRYVLSHRIRKKHAAAALVGRFLRDHILRRGEKMLRLVQNFKARVIAIQRFWRKHQQRIAAALAVHMKLWDRVLHEPDLTAAELQAQQSALVSSPRKPPAAALRRGLSVSAALVAKYHLASNKPPPASRSGGASAKLNSQTMNLLKEVVLEKLHERRVRIEAEQRRQREAAEKATTAAGAATAAGTKSPNAPGSAGSGGGGSAGAGQLSPAAPGSPMLRARSPVDGLDPSAQHSRLHIDATLSSVAAAPLPPTWAEEHEKYKQLFLPAHMRGAGATGTASGSRSTAQASPSGAAAAGQSQSQPSSSPFLDLRKSADSSATVAATPLHDHLRRTLGSAFDPRAIQAMKARKAALGGGGASNPASTAAAAAPSSLPAGVIPHSHPAPVPSLPVIEEPKPKLPEPPCRKPLYPVRLAHTLQLSSPGAAALAASQALGLVSTKAAAAEPAQLALQAASARKQAARHEMTGDVVELDTSLGLKLPRSGGGGGGSALSKSSLTPAAASSPSHPPSTAGSEGWQGLVVNDALKRTLLRQALRESRHAHWVSLRGYRKTLDAFLSGKLSSNESSLERARLFLTGSSAKLLKDQHDYIVAHPAPRRPRALSREMMRMLIIQGFLDQSALLDQMERKRERIMQLINAAPMAHAVPELFRSAEAGRVQRQTSSVRGSAGASSVNSPLSSPRAAASLSSAAASAEAAVPVAAKKVGLRNLNSTLMPSPVRQLLLAERGESAAPSSAASRKAQRLANEARKKKELQMDRAAIRAFAGASLHAQNTQDDANAGEDGDEPVLASDPVAPVVVPLAPHAASPPPTALTTVAAPPLPRVSHPWNRTGSVQRMALVPDHALAGMASGHANVAHKEDAHAATNATAELTADAPAAAASPDSARDLNALFFTMATSSSHARRSSLAESRAAMEARAKEKREGAGGFSPSASTAVFHDSSPRRPAGRPAHMRKATMEASALFSNRPLPAMLAPVTTTNAVVSAAPDSSAAVIASTPP